MRIGIDARTILNPDKGDAIGSGNYTYQLIRHLLKLDKENEYVIFFDFRVREKDVKKFTQPNVKIKFFPYSDYKKYLPGVYNELLGTAILQKENLDVLHSTSHLSRIPASYKGKTVVTFHDLRSFVLPEFYPAGRKLKEKLVASLMAKKADRIIAVSNSLKNELKKFLAVPDEKSLVVYSGLDERFYEGPTTDSAKILSKYGIEKKYILFLGTIEPSKNISRLLEAFAKLKNSYKQKNLKFDYQLVLAGKRGWLSDEYQQMIKDLGLVKDVIFTGYVIGDELTPLLRNAEFFIMPSLYEGFGMTVLEAFAAQSPAILSRVASIPELAEDAAYLIDPKDTNQITEAMQKFIEDENLRGNYSRKGLQQAKKFNWEDTARKTLDIYRQVAND
jgi:glycosyltransferase involved in cell wall biosynthesis